MALKQQYGMLRRLGMAGMLVGLAIGCKKDEPVDANAQVFADFAKRVGDYVTLRNRLADSVGPLDPKMSQNEITSRSTKLASAIMAARQGAKPGDIFTPEVATIMASVIKEEYSRRPWRILETRGDAQEELPAFVPHVNTNYPTGVLATFPASLLPLLPKLPKEVEYRIVGTYMILRDIEGNVIVDLMPRAVPQEK